MEIVISQSFNLAELQNQFIYPDCIYVLKIEQQVFGTFNSPLVIPENSTLKFDGGKFVGGYIRLNNTTQNDVFHMVWDNVNILGTTKDYIKCIFKNDFIRPEWFGAIGDGTHDDTEAIQQAIKLSSINGSIVKLLARRYLITKTINIFSGTHIEGTLPGGMDRNNHSGTSIEVNLKSSAIALDLNSNYKENGVLFDPSGCYKFILENFSIVNKNTNIPATAIRMYSEGEQACPRNGVFENIFIYYFNTGLMINALSYVKFNYVCVNYCKNAVIMDQIGILIEFVWFDNLCIGADSNETDAIGIKITSGNNIYFNKTDINDCKHGFWISSSKPIFNYFITAMNITRCENSIWLHANSEHITRVTMSDVSIFGTSQNNDAILFTRNMPYNIAECVFCKIFDSLPNQGNFMKIESIGLEWCYFEKIRTYNKISGFSRVKKIEIFSISNFGEFIIPSGTVGFFTHVVSSSSPFDHAPMVIVTPQRDFALSSICTNTQMSNLAINIAFEGKLQEDLLIRYYFPQL